MAGDVTGIHNEKFEKMIALFHVKKEVDIKVISAAFHAIYYAALHKAEKRNTTLINR